MRVLLLSLLMIWTGLAMAAEEPLLPDWNGQPVVDEAGLFKPQQHELLTRQLGELDAGLRLLVVTLPTTQGHSLGWYVDALGRQWQLQGPEVAPTAWLVIAADERQAWIGRNAAAGERLTDRAIKLVMAQDIAPALRLGRFEAAALDGSRALGKVLAGDLDIPLGLHPAKQQDEPPSVWAMLVFAALLAVAIYLLAGKGSARRVRWFAAWRERQAAEREAMRHQDPS